MSEVPLQARFGTQLLRVERPLRGSLYIRRGTSPIRKRPPTWTPGIGLR